VPPTTYGIKPTLFRGQNVNREECWPPISESPREHSLGCTNVASIVLGSPCSKGAKKWFAPGLVSKPRRAAKFIALCDQRGHRALVPMTAAKSQEPSFAKAIKKADASLTAGTRAFVEAHANKLDHAPSPRPPGPKEPQALGATCA
jgi:hypothetical protein